MDAATRIFAEQGYANASVADICASAGLSKRQFYEEFQTREDALISAYERIQTEISATLRDVIDATQNGRATQGADVGFDQRSLVRSVLRPLLGFISDDPYRAKIIFVAVVGVSERMERRRRDTRHALAELFEIAIRLTGPRARARGGPQLAISMLVGALNGLANEWLLTEAPVSVDELTDLLTPPFDLLVLN